MFIPRPTKLRHIVAAKTKPSWIRETEITQVLNAYDLGELKSYSVPAVGSTRSQNLILETGKGRKVLKRYKYSLGLDAITYEHSVLGYLATTNFPAPRLVPNRDGKVCTELVGKYYAITDFIAGYKYSDFFILQGKKKRFIEQAACTLAYYHQLIDGFVPEGKKTDGFMPSDQKRWQEADWYLRAFERYELLLKEKSANAIDMEPFFQHNIDRFKQDFVNLSQRLDNNNHFLSKLVIHGDYGPYNLLFDRDQLAAVLDFECTHLDWRAGEVINAIYRFAGTRNGINYDQARTFLSAYRSHCALTSDEIALMPDIFRFAQLRGLIISLRDYFELGVPARLHSARRKVWWIDWMKMNAARLTKVLSVQRHA